MERNDGCRLKLTKSIHWYSNSHFTHYSDAYFFVNNTVNNILSGECPGPLHLHQRGLQVHEGEECH